MANEIRITLQLQVINGDFKDGFTYSDQWDQTAIGASAGVQIVGTSAENLDLGDVATNGVLVLHNLDDTNFVTYGLNDSAAIKACGKIKPGEVALLRLVPGIDLMCQADTADVKLRFLLLED